MCSKVDYTAKLVNKRLSVASQNNAKQQSGQHTIINNNFMNVTNNFSIKQSSKNRAQHNRYGNQSVIEDIDLNVEELRYFEDGASSLKKDAENGQNGLNY